MRRYCLHIHRHCFSIPICMIMSSIAFPINPFRTIIHQLSSHNHKLSSCLHMFCHPSVCLKPLRKYRKGEHGSVDWLRHYATSRKVEGSIPDEIIDFFFNLPNPSSRTVSLGSTQPLIEMSTRNLPGGKGRAARKVHSLTAICEPIV
jgi:hypothetical protein